MAKSSVQIAYDVSSEEEEDVSSAEERTEVEEMDGSEEVNDGNAASEEGEEQSADEDDTGNDDEDSNDEVEEDDNDNKEGIDDGEQADEESENENDEKDTEKKSSLADVMAKILRKQTPEDKPVILSKALTDKEVTLKRKLKDNKETGDMITKKKMRKDESSSDEDDRCMSKEQQKKRKAWEELGRKRVDITEKEKEKRLQRIATTGVLQLFNAVTKQQKMIDDKIREVGSSERKKDDVMKSITKGTFLDMLKTTPNVSDEPIEIKKLTKKKTAKGDADSDSDGEDKPSWNILRDDFMMGAKMKDWDKEEDGEDEASSMGNDGVMDDGESSGSDS